MGGAYASRWVRPLSTAKTAIWVRELRSSLAKIFATCRSTVRSLITSASAIARFVAPCAIRAATSRSRGVRSAARPSLEEPPGAAVAAADCNAYADPHAHTRPRIRTETNRHGGMLGGISSGEPIVCRVAVKPTSSIPRPQRTVTRAGEPTEIATRGRHDPCLLPRFVPMGEAMVALVLADHWLRWRAQCGG